jgi:outer membrane receptor protein involved in Fe transport
MAMQTQGALHALIACAALSVAVLPVQSQPSVPAPLRSDIPAEALPDALAAFARQTGLNVLYVSKVIRDQTSRAVGAGVSAPEALSRLLEGTGLEYEFLTSHSVRILIAPNKTAQAAKLPTEPQPLQEVLVTGSRIPVPVNATAASPILIVTAEDIRMPGHTDAAEVLTVLPQMTLSSGSDFGNHSNPSNIAGGFATADLRGLRPQRTVVLVNGRRLGLGDPNTANPTPAPDLDQIPLAMVERVEVLTGGASATYGSDAVAGVVNFILKDHIQGIQIDAQYGAAEHSQHSPMLKYALTDTEVVVPTGTTLDAFRRDVSVLAGTDFDDGDGQISGWFIFKDQDAVHGADRDFMACQDHSINSLSLEPTDPGVVCLGSSQSNRFDTAQGDAYSVVGNQFVPWPAGHATPPAFFNPAPYYTAQRQNRRYQAGLLAHVELNEAIRPYLEASFMQDQTLMAIAPSGLFTGPDYQVNCSNPLLSAQEAGILCTPAEIAADKIHPGSVSAVLTIGRRNVEGTARQSDYRHRNYRLVAGIDGRLSEPWSYDAYALYYHTSLLQKTPGFLSLAAIANALEVTTDASGRSVCISGGNCVPYDIFGTGTVTKGQVNYLSIAGTDHGSNSEAIVEADVTGQLGYYGIITPWAHEGAAVNAGLEHRSESLQFEPDAIERSGDLSGFGLNVVDLDKRVSVDEGFIEIRLPLAAELPLASDLSVAAGYRYSVYSTAGTTNTYKFDLHYAPIRDLQLRASYDRVVRAPNLIELFTPLSYGASTFIDTDPCAPTDGGVTHAAATLAACRRTGITAAQYGNGLGAAVGGTSTVPQCPFGCGAVAGGNPSLAPEIANTWSLGATFTPEPIPSLSVGLDYYHIHLRGEIATVPETVTLQQCLLTGDPTLCSQIVRASSGALYGADVLRGGYVLSNAQNTGQALVSGIDVQANYRLPLSGWGNLAATLTGSYLQHNAATPYRTAPKFDCAGLFGATCLDGSVNPSWRHNVRLTWDTPWNLEVSAQWRFIGRTSFDNNSSQPLLQNAEEGFFDPYIQRIPNYNYVDLTAAWTISRHVQLRVGCNNLFDKDPPFIPLEISGRGGNLNTFPIYDLLGRNLFIALHASL